MRHKWRLLGIQVATQDATDRRKPRGNRASSSSPGGTARGRGHQIGEPILTRRLGNIFTQRSGMATGRGAPNVRRNAFFCLNFSCSVKCKEKPASERQFLHYNFIFISFRGLKREPTVWSKDESRDHEKGIQPLTAHFRWIRLHYSDHWRAQRET